MNIKNGLKAMCFIVINVISSAAILLCRQFTFADSSSAQENVFSVFDCFQNKSADFVPLYILGFLTVLFALVSIPFLLFFKGIASFVPCFLITLCEILSVFYVIFVLAVKKEALMFFVNSNAFIPMLLAFTDSLIALSFLAYRNK